MKVSVTVNPQPAYRLTLDISAAEASTLKKTLGLSARRGSFSKTIRDALISQGL